MTMVKKDNQQLPATIEGLAALMRSELKSVRDHADQKAEEIRAHTDKKTEEVRAHADARTEETKEDLAGMMQREFLSIHERFDAADADRAQIKATQEEHSNTLQEHTEILKEHSDTLADHGDQLTSMNRKLDIEISEHDRMQKQQDAHSTQLANHAERLTNLEHAKAA